jgi:hypothetical protein
MGNIRIERVPIQEMGLWRIRADHLMLVYQQDPLDYGEFQDRWWVMEGTRDLQSRWHCHRRRRRRRWRYDAIGRQWRTFPARVAGCDPVSVVARI